MEQYLATSKSPSTSSAAFSSPALPELNLDASLQRLHQEEDNSTSSISSIALSRAWLRETLDQGDEPSSPRRSPQPLYAERNTDFRFPPLEQNDIKRQSLTGVQPEAASWPVRPRTSRGLSEPKPFLSSSSRSTSIASTSEIEPQSFQGGRTQIGFGTPFTGNAFQPPPDESEEGASDTEQHTHSRHNSASSQASKSHFQERYIKVSERRSVGDFHQGTTQGDRRTGVPSSNPMVSPWTILFAPLDNDGPTDLRHTRDAPGWKLLPLLPSLKAQVDCLKAHLSTYTANSRDSAHETDIECYLDLSSISGLPAGTLAHIADESWPPTFERFARPDSEISKDATIPLPYFYRKTGLPIVALVRYAVTTTSPPDKPFGRGTEEVDNRHFQGNSEEPPTKVITKELNSQGKNPWKRRESDMTISPTNTSKLGPRPMLTASQSYSGIPRTPVRRSPLPYSPQRTAFRHENHNISGSTPLMPSGSPMTHLSSYHDLENRSMEGKLRSLSLAAAYPLTGSDAMIRSERPSRMSLMASSRPQVATDLAFGLASPNNLGNQGQEETRSASPPSSLSQRQRYQSSRGSSHKSFPSRTNSLSTRSTRSTSLYSSRSRVGTASESQEPGGEADEDLDFGSRFWTQLTSLGEQVSRENKQVSGAMRPRQRMDTGNTSIASTASDASVFNYSPLGILVPTEKFTAWDSQVKHDGDDTDRPPAPGPRNLYNADLSITLTSMPHKAGPSAQISGLLGRRRAYSSMVPLTGWRAGDSDLLTEEGQNTAVVRELPQVLLLERSGRDPSEVLQHDTMDLVTPTAPTFQNRVRAQSFQPWTSDVTAVSDSATRKAFAAGGKRKDVWDETMQQLANQLRQSGRQPSDPSPLRMGSRATEHSPESPEAESGTAIGPNARSKVSPTTLLAASREEARPSSNQNSPLPGLLYENWAERVDGAVLGDLGRRVSTSQHPEVSAQDLGQSLAGSTTEGAQRNTEHNVGSSVATLQNSPSSSGSTMLGSAGSESSLRILRDSEWPLPHARSAMSRSTEDSHQPAPASFLSIFSPKAEAEHSELADDPMDTEEVQGGGASNQPKTDNTPMHAVPSRRPQSQGAPTLDSVGHQAEGRLIATADGSLPAAAELMTRWADLAQRIGSPGSMRLLCLAASGWPMPGPDATGAVPEHIRREPRLHTGPAMPSEQGPSAWEQQPRRLTRKKATMLGPIRIPETTRHSDGETSTWTTSALGESLAESQTKVVTRVKRSLSNIFDPPSPIRPGSRQRH